MTEKDIPSISDEAILEVHDGNLRGQDYCYFSDCEFCKRRRAEAELDPVEVLEEENRILKATLGVFFKVIVVDGKQYRPSIGLCRGCEHITMARGWECYFKPMTIECEYPDDIRAQAVVVGE